jgi:subtilisin family serine protease
VQLAGPSRLEQPASGTVVFLEEGGMEMSVCRLLSAMRCPFMHQPAAPAAFRVAEWPENRPLLKLAACALVLSLCCLLSPGFLGQSQAGSSSVELLVGVGPSAREAPEWPEGVLRVRKIPQAPLYRLWVDEGLLPSIVEGLRQRRGVAFVERAEQLTLPQRLTTGLHRQASQAPAAADPMAWSDDVRAEALSAIGSGEGVVVAVVDTGLDLESGFVEWRVWSNADEVPGNGRDDDGNGYVDDTLGWDFGGNDNLVQDQQGHGTKVSFLIQYLAPRATIMPLKVNQAENSSFTTGDVAEAIYYAISAGADVINMSFSGPGYSLALDWAAQDAYQAGCLLVAAGGNSGGRVEFPASLPETLAVGSVDGAGRPAGFSSFGPGTDIMAPGVNILTCGLDGVCRPESGTSFSTALVSGAGSLVLSMNSHLGPDTLGALVQAEDALEASGAEDHRSNASVPRLNGRKILSAVSPKLSLSASSREAPSIEETVSLDVRVPPTDTSTRVYFGLVDGNDRYWLTMDGSLQPGSSHGVQSVIGLEALSRQTTVHLFGQLGPFPAMSRQKLSSRTYEVLVGLTDVQGRLISPLVSRELDPTALLGSELSRP